MVLRVCRKRKEKPDREFPCSFMKVLLQRVGGGILNSNRVCVESSITFKCAYSRIHGEGSGFAVTLHACPEFSRQFRLRSDHPAARCAIPPPIQIPTR